MWTKKIQKKFFQVGHPNIYIYMVIFQKPNTVTFGYMIQISLVCDMKNKFISNFSSLTYQLDVYEYKMMWKNFIKKSHGI